MKKTKFVIHSHSLKVCVNFFFNYTFDQVNSFLEKNDYEELEDEYKRNLQGLYWRIECEKTNTNIYSIWIPEFNLDRKSLSILVHELHHAVEEQANEKGLDCEETKAYLIEHYFLKVLEKFRFN